MRNSKGMIKQSGDIHPPELDDDDIDAAEAIEPMATAGQRPDRQLRAAKPSLMPLLAFVAGGLLLLRLIR